MASELDALVASADLEIFKRLGVETQVVPAGADEPLDGTIWVQLRRPIETATLREVGVVRPQPEARVPVSMRPDLKKGDVLRMQGRAWRVAAAPERSRMSYVWIAPVEDIGPVDWNP